MRRKLMVKILPNQKATVRQIDARRRAIKTRVLRGIMLSVGFVVGMNLIFLGSISNWFHPDTKIWARVAVVCMSILSMYFIYGALRTLHKETGTIEQARSYIAFLAGVIPDKVKKWKLSEDYDQLEVTLRR
ncbi:MAG: hypothetical protein AAB597_03385 [Patescibacteria group bacterium]